MSFTRANPFGWFKTGTLTSDQINQIDTNVSNAVDKRDGYADTIESVITVTGDMSFESTASLEIADPASIFIDDGTLAIDCTVVGYSKPLRFGLTDEIVTSTSHTVAAAAYLKHIIVLHGVLTGTTNVILPTLSGYSKIIDNKCTGDYQLTVKTSAGSGVYIPNGKSGIVYCNGTDIVSGPLKVSNAIESIFWKGEDSAYGTTYQTLTVGGAITGLTDYEVYFADVVIGEKFEITYTAGLKGNNASCITYIQVTNTESWFDMTDSFFQVQGTTQRMGTVSCVYTAQSNMATFGIGLAAFINSSSYEGYVVTPLNFCVKRITP
jgi:hypothetical protein